MTGYGKATLCRNNIDITVEIKTVNNRYTDISCKMPRILFQYEDALRKLIADKVSRGRIDVFINISDRREKVKNINADAGLAKGYIDAAKTLSEKLGIENDLTVSRLMKIPDIIKTEENEEDNGLLGEILIECAKSAIDNLNSMREKEGEALIKDITARLRTLREHTLIIKERAPLVAEDYKTKLKERISEALKGVEYDEAKLLSEVAFFADKSNIDEELSRLGSHFGQAEDIVASGQPAGRKLDFLVQELNREANTICSKSSDITVTNNALALKSEIEKIREQVQNLE